MKGPCDGCKAVTGPAVSWKSSTPTVGPGHVVVFKRHRYCLKCAVERGLLSVDEAKRIRNDAKFNEELEERFRKLGWSAYSKQTP